MIYSHNTPTHIVYTELLFKHTHPICMFKLICIYSISEFLEFLTIIYNDIFEYLDFSQHLRSIIKRHQYWFFK